MPFFEQEVIWNFYIARAFLQRYIPLPIESTAKPHNAQCAQEDRGVSSSSADC